MAAERSGKRKEILKESARLFTLRGYHGTSMEDIAAAVGLTKSALYHHFRTKADILYEIYSAVVDEISKRFEKHPAECAPTQRLRLMMRDMLMVADMPMEIAVYNQEGPLLREILPRRQAKELHAREAEFTNYVVETVQQGIEHGELRNLDPTLTAFAIIGMISWAGRWYRASGRATPDEIADLFFSIAIEGAGKSIPATLAVAERTSPETNT